MKRTPRSRTRLATAVVLAPLVLGLVACGDDDADDPSGTETVTQTPTATDDAPDDPPDDPTDDAPDDGASQPTEGPGDSDLSTAANTALAAVEGGTVFSVDRDDRGTYEATVVTADGVEQELEIEADAVTITRGPAPDDDGTDDPDEAADEAAEHQRLLGVALDWNAALEASVGQSRSALMTGIDLSEDDGVALWEVQYGGDTPRETTVVIDAETGEVLRVEKDN